MTIHAALMTGKGTGAISTIEVFGYSAESVIREIFKPAGAKPVSFETGQVLLGTIADDVEVIDQVTLGCEGPDSFAIHCHGNPLIVEMIMELLRKHGASPVTAEQLLAETLASQESSNTIAIEARLAQPRAKTVQGTRIIANQTDGGLANAAQSWLDSIDDVYLDEIKAETVRILRNSQSAKLIIYGCTAVLTGPPNSGKSTLLNFLAGRQKAIVTGIKGTTRDWVEATCRIGSLSVNLIDTAGLDPGLSGPEPRISEAAQERTAELLEQADLVLLVLDGSKPADELDEELLDRISGKRIITVLNKSDLPAKLDISRLPRFLSEPIRISAKEGMGMEYLSERIRQESGTANFDLKQSTYFTDRQKGLLIQLANAESKQRAASIITDLLRGRL
jgi:tRNA modification GTPase